MKEYKVEFSCGLVRQTFSVELDEVRAEEIFDTNLIDECLVGIAAAEGVRELRKHGYRVRRTEYASPHDGGYVGPERVHVTTGTDSSKCP